MAQKQDIHTDTKLRFHVVQDELFVDLNLYQFGWEKCEPLHHYGPAVRNHFLFHYVISGRGQLELNSQFYDIGPGQGFLLCPNEISSYCVDEKDPWVYTWVEFDGLRARECMVLAGLSETQPIYTPSVKTGSKGVEQRFAEIVDNGGGAPIRLVGLCMVLLDEIVQTSKDRIPSGNKRLRDFI